MRYFAFDSKDYLVEVDMKEKTVIDDAQDSEPSEVAEIP